MHRRAFLSALPALALAPALARAGASASAGDTGWGDIAPLLARIPASMQPWLVSDAHRVEIILERRDARGDWHAARHGRRWARAWAPAASVAKLPMALLMAERVHALSGDASVRLALDAAPATGEWGDGEPLQASFARDLARTFAVSDNVPYNRWYELLGADAIHARLGAMGYPDVRLAGRLGSSDVEANRRTGCGRIEAADGRVLAVEPARVARARRFPFGDASVGRAWQRDDGTIDPHPRDMSHANFLPLADSVRMLRAFVRPDSVPAAQRWRIGGPMRAQLLHALALRPRDSIDPPYDPRTHPDGYARFFFHGADGMAPRPPGLMVWGKSGEAYGFLSEVAYAVEPATGMEFVLGARVQANGDGVVNDDRYDYDTVGRPLLAAIGNAALDWLRAAPPPAHAGAAHSWT